MTRHLEAIPEGLVPVQVAAQQAVPVEGSPNRYAAFDVRAWRAWAPVMPDRQAWQTWAATGTALQADPADALALLPDVSFLPALQRRRLDRLGRMFFHVTRPLVEDGAATPIVFSSRHGDTQQTAQLLQSVADGSGMSPTAFGLSVHNAWTGLWSIHAGQRCEMLALGGSADGLEQAVLAACGLLQEGAAQVLVVCAEDRPAPAYAHWIDDVPFPYAVALLLQPGDQWRLALMDGDDSGVEMATPLRSVRGVLGGQSSWLSACQGRVWHWQH